MFAQVKRHFSSRGAAFLNFLVNLLAVCASLAVVGGCAPLASQPWVINVAWVSQDKIYLLREIRSDSVELWLREAGRERKLASNADVPGHCGPLDFLFAVKPGTLGLAMACDGFTRLVSFSGTTGTFASLLDVPSAASVALADDGRASYIGTGRNGCWAIQPLGEARISYSIDWEEYSCQSGKSAKSPVLVGENGVVFLAANGLPPEQPVRDERRGWRLMITSQAGRGAEPVGPELHGLPDLALVPGGGKAVVATSFDGSGAVLEIDLRSGQSRRVYRAQGVALSPSVSPDGKRVAFVGGGRQLIVKELS
ncbi:hypothetical protein O7598_24565 [Micromonospora sp. WMMC241]|uniref:TolB family protein n=1 Tax=Micromonospora sp. WMMC241 TaxID=3015159 RepID=UPI0022B5FAD9|nr:hypothetical protein [Micromonospora sp. WMMC241]MCZ7439600.1 hypothetical protein [Micromonospora sp. WMMC241]